VTEGCAPPTEHDPIVERLEVTPQEFILKPGGRGVLKVTAVWSDGMHRDATPWALYDSRDDQLAEVTPTGEITARRAGRVAVTVRYAGQVAAVDVTIPYGEKRPHGDFVVRN